MVHAYRNRDRNTRLVFMAIFDPLWMLGGVAIVGVAFEQSPLTVLLSAPLFVLWASPIYTEFFLRFYEIQLSDDGACEFKAALRSKPVRAQQIISVERDDRGWRLNDEETEETAVQFQGGSLVVVQPVDDFADFLAWARTLSGRMSSQSQTSRCSPTFFTFVRNAGCVAYYEGGGIEAVRMHSFGDEEATELRAIARRWSDDHPETRIEMSE